MSYDLSQVLVVGVSSRALFNLEEENALYEQEGLETFTAFQKSHEHRILEKGTAFSLVEALLNLNHRVEGQRLVEVVVMSRNSPDTGLRIMHSLEHYGLDIKRTALTGGEPLAPYLDAFSIDLFLSKDEDDIQVAIDHGVAAAVLYNTPEPGLDAPKDEVRLAFDADAVVFSDESEVIYKQQGLDAFLEHELRNRNSPMNEGPFAKLIKTLSSIQKAFPLGKAPIRIAIVTARNSPAHIRVMKTLAAWGVYVDASFFLGGIAKDKVLSAFKPHLFFDDQDVHVGPASKLVPSGRVPYKSGSPLNKKENP